MEHIQCPHCARKYAVSDKLRAATGKQIRCKHCQQAFEIIIQHSTPPDTVPGSAMPTQQSSVENSATTPTEIPQYSTEQQPATDHLANDKERPPLNTQADKQADKPTDQQSDKKKAATKKDSKKKNGLNLQLIITISLSIILLGGMVAAYLFLFASDSAEPTGQQTSQPLISTELVKPVVSPLAEQGDTKETVDSEVQTTAATQAKQTARKQASASDKPDQVCKDAAAEYWLRTHKLATTLLHTEVYMKLLKQNIDQAAEIRTLCPDRQLITRLTEAAKNNRQPSWIKREITTVMQTEQTKASHQ